MLPHEGEVRDESDAPKITIQNKRLNEACCVQITRTCAVARSILFLKIIFSCILVLSIYECVSITSLLIYLESNNLF